jgi:hypothetical protein
MYEIRRTNFVILLAGFGTSVLAVVLVAALNMVNANIMGWHVWFIVPVGAIGVGVLSGLGYAFGSWLSHVKIRSGFILIVLAVAVLTYVLSHYVTYLFFLRANGSTVAQFSFVEYMRLFVEESTYQMSRSSTTNNPGVRLGAWGYLFLVVELVGFCLGCLIPTLVLRGRPYCDRCQRYMPKTRTIYHASDATKADLKATKGKELKNALLRGAADELLTRFGAWWGSVGALTWEQLEYNLDEYQAKPQKTTLAHVVTDLYVCGECEQWHALSNLISVTLNGKPARQQIHDSRSVERTVPLSPPPLSPPPLPPLPRPGSTEGGEGIRQLD